jgi:hypothetical protein
MTHATPTQSDNIFSAGFLGIAHLPDVWFTFALRKVYFDKATLGSYLKGTADSSRLNLDSPA